MSNYNKRPAKIIENSEGRVFRGDREISECLQSQLKGDSWILIAETYPGVAEEKMRRLLESMNPDLVISAREIIKDGVSMSLLLENILTDDRVFGRMYYGNLTDFIDPYKADYLRAKIEGSGGKVAVYGFGASLLCDSGLVDYRKEGKWMHYSLSEEGMKAFRKMIDGYIRTAK